MNASNNAMQRKFRDADISRSQQMCEWLAHECTNYEATPAEITQRFPWHHTYRAAAIKYARAMGYADGHKNLVRLTEDGLARFDIVLDDVQRNELYVSRASRVMSTPPKPRQHPITTDVVIASLPEQIVTGSDTDTDDVETELPEPYSQVEHQRVAQSLSNALKVLPTKHASFLELMLSAVVARHHYAEEYPSGHPGFMAIGNTGTGKTAVARFLCTLMGFDDVQLTLQLRDQTKGNLVGRRMRSGKGFDFSPPPEAMHPFLLIDEWSFGDDALRNYALKYFQSDVNAKIEGRIYNLRPVPMLTSNYPEKGDDRYSIFPVPYRRRSVVFDTSGSDRRSTEKIIREFSKLYPSQIVDLWRLPLLTNPVNDEAIGVLSLTSLMLTDKGDGEYITDRTLEILMRGYCTLYGAPNDARTALHIVGTYLTVTATMPGHVVKGWKNDLSLIGENLHLSSDAIAQLIARNQQSRYGKTLAVVETELSDAELRVRDLQVAERRGVFMHKCDTVVTRLNPQNYEECESDVVDELASLCSVFRWLREQAMRAHSFESLDELNKLAMTYQDRITNVIAYTDQYDEQDDEPYTDDVVPIDVEVICSEIESAPIDDVQPHPYSSVLQRWQPMIDTIQKRGVSYTDVWYDCINCRTRIDRVINRQSANPNMCVACGTPFPKFLHT